ncbi:MAG TPA: SulP family inorganic anion transporter, partial [Actinomycetota bacterium]
MVVGVLEVVVATSFAALIFSGPLAEHLPAGIGLGLVAAAAILITVALVSSHRGTFGSVQDISAAVLSIVAASIVADLPPEDPRVFLTVVAAITLTSLLTGGFFLLLGTFRLGDVIRFVPYPVVGGFLAGTGWLLFRGGMEVVSGVPLAFGRLGVLAESDVLARWIPGVVFAVVLLVLARRSQHPMVIPLSVLGGIGAFYVVVLVAGAGIGAVEEAGWLLGPFPEGGLWEPWVARSVAQADWSAVVGEAGNLATILIVSLLALLLNASGIELVVGRDLDLNRELRAAGIANLAAGLGGGLPGFHALSLTALAYKMGARSRAAGVVAGGVCVVALVAGGGILGMFPRPVLGGIIVFLGLAFLVEWVVDAWALLPRSEYLIVVLILVVVAAVGFLPGVALGVLLAVVLFAVAYGRSDVVKHALSGATYHSKMDRPLAHREVLRRDGDRIHVLELQGFLFFGTANALLDRIRARATDGKLPPLRFLVLDFRRVIGLDSSVVLSFSKTQRLAASSGFAMVLTSMGDGVRRALEQGGLTEGDPSVRFFPDLDRGLQWCEDGLLDEEGAPEEPPGTPWREALAGVGIPEDVLLGYMERIEAPAGEILIRQGDRTEDVLFLESGQVTTQVTRERGGPVRLQTLGPGAVVGEVALYAGGVRSATVVAERPSVLHRLTRDRLHEMEQRDPFAAAALHRL